jgi:dihydroneopterin aldolase
MGQWLRLEGIRFECVIGVTDPERRVLQEVVVDLEVRTDFGKAAASDSLRDAVDYRRLAQCIVDTGRASTFQLIETLASHLARTIFDRFPGVLALRLELEKPHALKAARAVKAVIVARRPPP